MTRKICVVTGTRADYGLLSGLMRRLRDDPAVTLQVVACAMHLSPEFGLTWRQIAADGFTVDARVEMLLSADSPSAITKSVGLGCIGFADAFARLAPDVVVVLGDRFEMLAAAQAAVIGGHVLAHIHGGELTEGMLDDSVRHAISKLAHLHFTAAEDFRRRLIRMGERPETVHTVGAPGLEAIRALPVPSRAELAEELGFDLGETLFVVTYHPVSWSEPPPERCFSELLSALDGFPEARIIITWPNADAGGRAIIPLLEAYAAARPQQVLAVRSLGQHRYVAAVRHAAAVIGNSSSGLIEVPSLGTATVNIGRRQNRRPRAVSVIDCADDAGAIRAAIMRALSPDFRSSLAAVVNPYDAGPTAERIAAVLTGDLADAGFKRFHDAPA